MRPLAAFGFFVIAGLSVSGAAFPSLAAAQQTTTLTKPKTPPPPAKPPAKPVATVGKPVAKPVSTAAAPSSAKPAVPPAAPATRQNASTTGVPTPSATGQTTGTQPAYSNSGYASPSSSMMQTQPQGAAMNTGRAAPSVPANAQGNGTIPGCCGYTLTAYNCFRSNTRVFCDTDISNTGNVQSNSSVIYNTVKMVGDGGRMIDRHAAYFVGSDGSQFQNGYISPDAPVRMMMEYDDVPMNITSISLVNGGDRVQSIPIVPMDPNQPAGTMPARMAPAQNQPSSDNQGQNPMTTAANAVDQAQSTAQNAAGTASQTVNNASQQKQKAKGWWQSVQSNLPQPH